MLPLKRIFDIFFRIFGKISYILIFYIRVLPIYCLSININLQNVIFLVDKIINI